MRHHPMPALTMTALRDTPAKRHQAALQLATWLLCGAVAAFGASVVQAAETSAAAASALKVLSTPLSDAASAPSPSGQATQTHDGTNAGASITVQKGESIDAVIRRGLPGLILNDEFMRQALAKANPRIFPKGRTYPVRPGTVLMLPSHEALRQQILLQYPQTAALFQTSTEPAKPAEPAQASGPDKRRWVRFP
ncbi:hypothetical protein B9Z34_00145 [Limnohabitans sp. Hippo3]|nr:hypothetical protein B9Z34_00145 [Limnohabitans sp. Hippo3]